MRPTKITAEVEAILEIHITADAPEDLFSRGKDPEWHEQLYGPMERTDVIAHWAHNAASNGVDDVCVLDGWADVPRGAVRLYVSDVTSDPWMVSGMNGGE